MEQFKKPVIGSMPTIVRTYSAAVTRAAIRQFGAAPPIWQRNYGACRSLPREVVAKRKSREAGRGASGEHVIREDDDHNRILLYFESNVGSWADDADPPSARTA